MTNNYNPTVNVFDIWVSCVYALDSSAKWSMAPVWTFFKNKATNPFKETYQNSNII